MMKKKFNKYKLYNSADNLIRYPNRILNFKRPKWLSLKGTIQDLGKQEFSIHDLLSSNVDDTSWDRVDNDYLKKLLLNLNFKLQFKNSISYNLKKRNIRNLLLAKYFKNYYNIGVLLLFLDFYRTKSQADQKIHFGNINLNDALVSVNSNIGKGDILYINDTTINLLKNSQSYNTEAPFLTYVEIDDYSQSLIILKDLDELSLEDFYLINSESLDITSLT